MAPRPTRLLLPALLLLAVTACSDKGDPTASTSSTTSAEQIETTDADDVGDVVIQVRDNSFAPDTADVAVGDTVTWDFSTADRAHDVVFDADRGSPILDDGTWSTSFDQPSAYAYECTLHSGMTGHITVSG